VWTKEVPFGYFLPIYRAILGMKFKIIFANGGAFRPQTYKDFDFIQHLTQESYDEACHFGISPEKMAAITNIVNFHETSESRRELRKAFGYSDDDYLVICVSAWNAYHKRIDYLINEVGTIDNPRVKLLLCGHPDAEYSVLKKLAQEKLADRVKWMTLPEQDVHRALRAADVFVLPSLEECLGNSIIEAVFAGLPVVASNHTASRFIFGCESEWVIDLSKEGALKDRLLALRSDTGARERIQGSKERVDALFSRQSLIEKFYNMVVKVTGNSSAPRTVHMDQLGKQT
jgi:glycosyltransferase involved in cell wall biosynthesis